MLIPKQEFISAGERKIAEINRKTAIDYRKQYGYDLDPMDYPYKEKMYSTTAKDMLKKLYNIPYAHTERMLLEKREQIAERKGIKVPYYSTYFGGTTVKPKYLLTRKDVLGLAYDYLSHQKVKVQKTKKVGKVKTSKTRLGDFRVDSDKDGVPDLVDCNPLNPKEQDVALTFEKMLDKGIVVIPSYPESKKRRVKKLKKKAKNNRR